MPALTCKDLGRESYSCTTWRELASGTPWRAAWVAWRKPSTTCKSAFQLNCTESTWWIAPPFMTSASRLRNRSWNRKFLRWWEPTWATWTLRSSSGTAFPNQALRLISEEIVRRWKNWARTSTSNLLTWRSILRGKRGRGMVKWGKISLYGLLFNKLLLWVS